MRNSLFFYWIFLLISFGSSFAQTNCECKGVHLKNEVLNDLVETKNKNELDSDLKKLGNKSISCSQFSLVWRIQFFIKVNEPDSAKKHLSRLVEYNSLNNCPQYLTAFEYYTGYLFLKQEQYDSAAFFLLKAVDLAKENNILEYKAKSNLSLALVFDRLAQPEKSVVYYKMGLQYAKEVNDKKLLLGGMANLQSCYGLNYDKSQNVKYLDSIKSLCFETLKLAKLENGKKEVIRSYVTLAGAYLSSKEYSLCLAYCDSAISNSSHELNKAQLHSAYFKAAQCYIEMKQYKKAIIAADSSLKYAENKTKKSNAIYRLYEANKATGDFSQALHYLEQSKQLDEEVMINDRMEIVTELEQKYNKSENEKKINELNKEKEISSLRIKLLLVGFVLAIFLILFIVFWSRQKMLKNKQSIMEAEQRLNRARINPHFFFNALTAMQGLALKENDGKKVAMNLFSFSKLMRKTLESTYSDFITIEKEVEFLTDYLNIQKLRNSNSFKYDISFEKEIQTEEFLIPAMIIQPFVENAIEHGFNGINYIGELKVKFGLNNGGVEILIIDNGLGVNAVKEKEDHISRATQITKDRLFLLNKSLGKKADFNLYPNAQKGVIVKIYVPLILRNESTGSR